MVVVAVDVGDDDLDVDFARINGDSALVGRHTPSDLSLMLLVSYCCGCFFCCC